METRLNVDNWITAQRALMLFFWGDIVTAFRKGCTVHLGISSVHMSVLSNIMH